MLNENKFRLSADKAGYAGKKIISIFCVLIFYTILTNIFSNPIRSFFINEFMFDTTGWILELHPISVPGDSISLDNCYLTSRTDTAYFNNGIYLSPERYTIINQFDLQNPFNINETCDTITLYLGEGDGDILFFGNSGLAPTPKRGQSICLRVFSDGSFQNYFYYLDNTPTFGLENDTLNAKGYIDGYIKDSLNNPIQGVKIIYGYIDNYPNPIIPIYVETNSSGYFILRDFSILKYLEFEKEGFYAPDTSVQIWPDSTVTINIQMKAVVGITELLSPLINNFELTQNYPNPFNGSTTFIYSILEEGYVEINIYDEKGELIQKLFNGNQSKGQYKVNWNANNLASGIYFYELEAGSKKLSKKCLLLK